MRLIPASSAAALNPSNDRDTPGVSFPAPARQKIATCVCSGVRTVLSTRPRSFTWSNAAVYAGLSIAGGPGGRKSATAGIANGVTLPQSGRAYAAFAGGVGTHWPGPLPG